MAASRVSSKPAEKSVSQLQDHLGYWLRCVSNQVSHAFALKVESHGVTVAEWVLLRQLHDHPAAHPSELADALGMARGSISKLAQRLCDKHLAQRDTVEGDQRFQRITLTPQGRRLVPTLARLADQNDRDCFGHLSARQHQTLLKTLQAIAQHHHWTQTPTD